MTRQVKIKSFNPKSCYKKNFIQHNQFDQEKFSEWLHSPSFSFVILFFKFIREDFFQTGDLSFFKSYFQENCKEFQHYLINIQEIKNTVIRNNYISSDLLRPAKEMQEKLIEMSNKIRQIESQGELVQVEMQEEFAATQRRFQKFNETTLGKYTPDLKSLLSNYDTLGQTSDLTNLDSILDLKNGAELLETFFDASEESELEGVDRASAFLLRVTHGIYAALQDQNMIVQTNYCHFQHEIPFLTSFEEDLRYFAQEKKGCYFYLLQEVNNLKLSYGIFVFYRFAKLHICFYNPSQGVSEFSSLEFPKFKFLLEKILKNYGNNYCSFRIFLPNKIQENYKQREEINSATLFTIIKQSAYSYKESLQEINSFFSSYEQKETLKFCNSVLNQLANQEGVIAVVTEFFAKFSEFIFKIKASQVCIQNKSFFTFFLINYLTRFPDLAKQQLNFLEFGLGKDKISDYTLNFFNNKNSFKSPLIQKTMSAIFIETYKNICKVSHRIPYPKYFLPVQILQTQSILLQKLFESFDMDYKTTTTDWNRQAVIYNEKYISGRADGKFVSNYTIESIGKNPIPSQKIPTKEELEIHFLQATNCQDSKLMQFCLGVCNQTHFFGLGHLIVAYFNIKHDAMIGLSKKYIFIQKMAKYCYDFLVLFYIDEYDHIGIETEKIKKLKDPIYFTYVFTLDTENPKLKVRNIRVGFLNKTKNSEINKGIQNKLMEAFNDEMLHDFYSNKKSDLLIVEKE